MGSDKRHASQRPKFLRKGGKSRRVSDLSIWEQLRAAEATRAPRVKLIQNQRANR